MEKRRTPDGDVFIGKISQEFSKETLRRHHIPLNSTWGYPEYCSKPGIAIIVTADGEPIGRVDMVHHRILSL